MITNSYLQVCVRYYRRKTRFEWQILSFLPSFIYAFFFSLYEKIRRQLLIYNVIGKKDCFIQISFLMHRHRCYVTLLSLSVLYFFFTTHTHTRTFTTYTVCWAKKKEKERKKKQDCLPANNHVNCRTHVYTPSYLTDVRALSLLSVILSL